ncbi:MAG: flippase-like domain-containing protein [bacterium]|nr:flippase-like domain-containing protein [bacterium]
MATFLKNKQFWGALIGIALLAFCVKDIRLSELQTLAERVNLYYLLPAVVSAFIFMYFKGLRWRTIISKQKRITKTRAVTLYSTGTVLSIIMPVLTGQVGRVILFSRKEDLRKTFVFSTIVLEVLFDAISLVIFMFLTSLAFVFPENYRYLSFVVSGVTLGALLGFYLILHFQENVEACSERCFRRRWPGLYITIKKFIRSFTKGIDMLRSSQHMLGTMVYSLLAWTAHMLVVWFLMRSFGLELPFAAAAVVMIVNTIVLMIPITPGNAGTFEFAVSTSLAAFSVGRSDAVLFALALHLMDLLPVFVYGAFFLRQEKLSISDIKADQAEDLIIDKIDEEGAYIEEEEEKQKV